ncbi:uncharacterized protein LOC112691280, partial [Sipha flava]|uniref:Uncharacterized protein LOC112691280 n=1 Tax=Sipha flava TaxID=143950 RepID=A0A8B8GEH4_9HEMI
MANKKNMLKRKRSTKNMVSKTLAQRRLKKPSDSLTPSHTHALCTEINDNNANLDLKGPLVGRRIVDIAFFIKQIQVRHKGPFGCSFIDMEFQSEVIHGFYSIFVFKCKVCCIESKLYLENIQQNQYMLINKAVVNTCQSIAKAVNEVAWDEIKKSGEEERKLAIQYGDIDIDGVPMITVVADGQWSKRSYKTKYDALSGV